MRTAAGVLVAIGAVAACVLAASRPMNAGASSPSGRALAVPSQLKVVSYFPANAGWTFMWQRWNPRRLGVDFARIAALRANTVRLVVQPTLFGYPHPRRIYLERLARTIDLAARRGLHVQLTLFDWWGTYEDLAGSKAWADAILRPYVDDPRIALVEVRNEIDPYDARATAWAHVMIPHLRSLLRGRTKVAISVSGPNPLVRLSALVRALRGARPDVFSFHYFGGGGELSYKAFARAKATAAPTPLWIGETGYPTSVRTSGYLGVPLTADAQEAAQAHFLKMLSWAARANGLPSVGVWVLDDFLPGAIPTTVPGSGSTDVAPREAEYHFGLHGADGRPKNAAQVMRTIWSGRSVTEFNNGFDRGVADEAGEPVPAEWALRGDAASELALDRQIARRGASARIGSRTGEPASGAFSIVPVAHGSCTGAVVGASVWARGVDVTGTVRLVLTWIGWNEVVLGEATSPALPEGTTDWGRLGLTAAAPAGAVYLRLSLVSSGNRGTVWFDDVAFRPADCASTPSSSSR